jgi:peptide/nickel transport system substrate-binding protein
METLRGKGNFRLLRTGPVGESTFLTFHQGERDLGPLFSRKEFRQAISHGIHRGRMIQEVLGGWGRPQWSPISPATPAFHSREVRTYPFDPTVSAGILRSLDLIDRNGDGIRETKDGIPLDIELILGATTPSTLGIAERIVSDLSALGIRAHLRPLGPEAILQRIQAGDWDALVQTIPEADDPQLLSRIWASRAEMHYWRPRQEEPATPWEAEIDAIFRQAAREGSEEGRRILYARFQEIASEEVPMIFTVQRLLAVAVAGRVEDFDPSPVGILHDIAYISVRP